MRPSLLPGLVTAAQRNRDRGFADGACSSSARPIGANPEDQLSPRPASLRPLALAGTGRHWSGNAPARRCATPRPTPWRRLPASASIKEPHRRARRRLVSSRPLGRAQARAEGYPRRVRRAASRVLVKLGVDAPIACFELYLDAIPRRTQGPDQGGARCFGFASREARLAFLLDADVAAADVARGVKADRALSRRRRIRRVPREEHREGKKSVAIEVTIQPRGKALTDAEIEAVAAKIVAAVTKATGGELRG